MCSTSPGRTAANTGRDLRAHGCSDRLEDLEVADLDASSQIVDAADRAVKGEHVRLDDIAHVAVVAGLAAVAEDDRLLPGQQLQGEDGHHAGFAVRVLPGPVDVGIAEHGVFEAVVRLVGEQVVLHRVLADAVGRDGIDRGGPRRPAGSWARRRGPRRCPRR